MKELPDRQSIRFPGFDYSSSGFYFITVCTQNKINYFGEIVGVLRAKPDSNPGAKPDNKTMKLNLYGKIVQQILESLPDHHRVCIDAYQIMPNHIHMILVIPHQSGIDPNHQSGIDPNHQSGIDPNHQSGIARNAPTTYQNVTAGSLSCIIRSFKSECTKQIRRLENKKIKIFQRNFYERIIRNKKEYFAIKKYIQNNPQNWNVDRENPENVSCNNF